MRKYIRLFMLLLALVSCVLMVIYRQKYSKLSLVFQMMNAFQFKDSETKCNERLYAFKKSLQTDWNTAERISGLPSWTEVLPGLHIYSAHWIIQITRMLAVSKNVPLPTLRKILCKLHYENEKQPIEANIKVHVLQKAQSSYLVFIECMPDSLHNKVPHSISFVYNKTSSNIAMPVIFQKSYISSYTMCVKPLPMGFSEQDKIVEFVAYHNHIGVNHFIFYDLGLSLSVKKVLLDFAAKSGIFITLLPWNIPPEFPVIKNADYLIECVQHVSSRNYSRFVLNLDINHFIIPKENENLNVLKKYFKPGFIISKLQDRKFCSEYPNDIFAENLNISFITLLKTKILENAETVLPIVYDVEELQKIITTDLFRMWLFKGNLQKTVIIPKTSAVIHSYENCNIHLDKENEIFSEDKYMWKYKDILFKSDLYRFTNNI